MYIKEISLVINYFQIIFYNLGENNMKSNLKSKIIILITLGIFFSLSPIITTYLSHTTGNSNKSSEYSDVINLDKENLKLSAVSGKIHIDNNWSAAKLALICTGEGTYSEPYIIEDLVIDGGGSGSCILIGNSTVFFKIENCTVYNSGSGVFDAGIKLQSVSNGSLLNNNASYNNRYGIYLYDCNNNTLSVNIANNNSAIGITLEDSLYNTVLGNAVKNNSNGIFLYNSSETIVLGNTVISNMFVGISLVGKPGSSNNNNTISGNTINNHGNMGIMLTLCNNNTISENTVNNNNIGNNENYGGIILLSSCNNNTISGNTVTYNNNFGISLTSSDNNNISGNNASNNRWGLYLNDCNNNKLSVNIAYNNSDIGITLEDSLYNTVLGNTVNNNKNGIFLFNSSETIVLGNTVINNMFVGISLVGKSGSFNNNNTISGNTVNNHGTMGIMLTRCNNHTISENTVNNNNIGNNEDYAGIRLSSSCNNTISGNTVNYNHYNGIILSNSNKTLIYNNIFRENMLNAEDNGTNNQWDNGIIGNNWADYNGKDADDNGIGDTPYNITGTAGSKDNFPIWWDPPVFSVNSPTQNEIFSNIAPEINITINEGIIDTIWYTVDGGITNFTCSTNDVVNQAVWDNLGNRNITLTFFANDSRNYVTMISVIVIKSIPSKPVIPGYNLFFLLGVLSIVVIILSKKLKKS